MKIKFIINFNQRTKLKKIETVVPNLLSYLDLVQKLKEGGAKWKLHIQLILIEGPNRTKSNLCNKNKDHKQNWKYRDRNEKALKPGDSLALWRAGERETAAAALTGHRRVHVCRRVKRAASPETPVDHLQRRYHHSRAT